MTTARLCAAVVLALLGASTAWGQAGWTTTSLILAPRSDGALSTHLVVGENGNALHLWTMPDAAGAALVAAYFRAADSAWTAPATIAQGASLGIGAAAFDSVGNAVVLFGREDSPTARYLYAVRYDATTAQWGNAARLSDAVAPGAPLTALAIGFPSSGGVTVVFAAAGAPQVSRASGPTGNFTAPQRLFVPMQAQVAAVEPDGGVLLAGADFQAVRAANCSTSGSCAPPVVVHAIATGLLPFLTLASNRIGGVTLAWEHGTVAAAIRTPQGVWSPATTLTSAGASHAGAGVGLDDAGNVIVSWQRFEPPLPGGTWHVQARRFDAGDIAWGATQTLSTSAIGPPAVAVAPGGSAFVAWRERTAGAFSVAAVRFRADIEQWGPATPLPILGDTADDPAAGADAAGNAIVAWRAAAGGASATLYARWRATPAMPEIAAVTPASTSLQIAVSPPPTVEPGLAPTTLDYSLDGGMTWTPRAPASLASPLVITGLSDGVLYDLRLRAVNVAGAGVPSGSLPVRSGTGMSPTDFRVVSRAGNTVTLAWVAPGAGIAPDGYVIEGGLAGQAQVLASVPTGGAATQATLVVPNGVFFVRVVARRSAIRIGQSADLQIAVNAGNFPSAPANLLGSAVGQRLALSWVNTWNGAAPTGLRIDVSGSIATAIDLPVTEQFTFDGVPPGTYTFAVTPLINSVPGDASNVVTLTFPGTCSGPPGTPTAFSASTQAGRVYLDWLPPTSGAAVTHYAVHAAGAFTGSFPLTARTFDTPVPPGSYTVSIAAVGPCGTSAPTAAQTVVVP